MARSNRNEMGSPQELVDAGDLNFNAIAKPEPLMRMPADERMQSRIELVVIVRDFVHGHESLDEVIDQFHREATPPDGDDDRLECFAEMLLHEKHLFPVEQLALGLIREPLALARFIGYRLELC